MLDILTIGHTTLDTFVQIPDAHIHCKLDTDACEICLNYGDKIIVEEMQTSMGGNAANSGAGLAKLGTEVGILTYLGKDEESERIVKLLKGFGVKKDWIVQLDGGQTDQSVILTYEGERTILAYHYPWDYQFPQNFLQTKWIYLTSINESFKGFHQGLLAWYGDAKGTVPWLAYNPGSHELKAGVAGNAEILKICQVLILNRQEAKDWVGSKHSQDSPWNMQKLLRDLRNLGPRVAVITDAQNGSFAYDGEKFYHQEIYPGERIEMTGAGDAFSAGFLGALLDGQNLQNALKWGNALASSVIGQVGATNGLLTRGKLLEIIKQP